MITPTLTVLGFAVNNLMFNGCRGCIPRRVWALRVWVPRAWAPRRVWLLRLEVELALQLWEAPQQVWQVPREEEQERARVQQALQGRARVQAQEPAPAVEVVEEEVAAAPAL